MRNGLQTSPRLSCRLVPTGYGTLGAVKLSIERRPGETGFHFFGYTARWGNIQKTCDFAGLLSYIRLRRVILLRSDIRLTPSGIRYASLGGGSTSPATRYKRFDSDKRRAGKSRPYKNEREIIPQGSTLHGKPAPATRYKRFDSDKRRI